MRFPWPGGASKSAGTGEVSAQVAESYFSNHDMLVDVAMVFYTVDPEHGQTHERESWPDTFKEIQGNRAWRSLANVRFLF